MVEHDRQRIRAAQREDIDIVKKQGELRGGKKNYHTNTTLKDKIIYDRVVQLLEEEKV